MWADSSPFQIKFCLHQELYVFLRNRTHSTGLNYKGKLILGQRDVLWNKKKTVIKPVSWKPVISPWRKIEYQDVQGLSLSGLLSRATQTSCSTKYGSTFSLSADQHSGLLLYIDSYGQLSQILFAPLPNYQKTRLAFRAWVSQLWLRELGSMVKTHLAETMRSHSMVNTGKC